jgi:predicted flap endonuclease-1-like 5' DNA nuclease
MKRDLGDIDTLKEQAENLGLEQKETEKLRAQGKELAQALRGQVDELGQVQEENEKLRARVIRLKEKYSDSEKQQMNIENQLKHEKTGSKELKAQLEESSQAQSKNEELRVQVVELNEQLEETQQLQEQIDELNNQQNDSEKLLAQINDLNSQLADSEKLRAQIDELTRQLAESEQLQTQIDELIDLQAESEQQHADVAKQLSYEQTATIELQARIEKLTAEIEASNANPEVFDDVKPNNKAADSGNEETVSDDTDSMPALKTADETPAQNGRDDLQLIRGVGAKLEQKLNMLGIVNFRGLLELTSQDYERAQELIPSMEKRVARDSWIDQARELHQEKYNEVL